MSNDAEKLGLPEAPAAPVLELPQSVLSDAPDGAQDAPAHTSAGPAETDKSAGAAASPQRAPRGESVPPRRVRRVGTGTMGIVLILVGLVLCGGMFRPMLDFLFLFRLSPLILVALGIEVLLAARQKDVRLKYDFLSMIVCSLVIVGALAASCLPVVFAYAGPPRSAAENAVSQALSEETFTRLQGNSDVVQVNYYIHLNLSGSRTLDTVQTPGDLTSNDSVHVSATLHGTWANEAAFAAACRPVIDAVLATGVPEPRIDIDTQSNRPDDELTPLYSLSLSGPYMLAMDDASLADYVVKNTYVPEAGYYMTADELRRWTEDENRSLQDEALSEAENRAEEAERRALEAEARAEDMEMQAEQAEQRILELETYTAELESRMNELEMQRDAA